MQGVDASELIMRAVQLALEEISRGQRDSLEEIEAQVHELGRTLSRTKPANR